MSVHVSTPAPTTDRRTLARTAAAGGLVFVALLVVSSMFEGTLPEAEAGAAEVVAYFQADPSGFEVNTWLDYVMVFPFVVFAVGLARLLHRQGAELLAWLTGIGAVLFTAVVTIGTSVLMAAARLAQEGSGSDAELVRVLYGIEVSLRDALLTLAVLTAVPASLAILRTGAAARSTAVLGLVLAASCLVGVTAQVFDRSSDLALFGFVGVFGFLLVWILAVSVSVLRRAR